MKGKKTIALLSCLLAIFACKEKYVAKTNYPFTGYLVVEGFIDASGAPTTFRISRTTTLDSATIRTVSGASVVVESSNNDQFPLYGDGPGLYTAAIPVNPALQYRLRIETGARAYLSDFSDTRITPPVDSVHWDEENDGVQIRVSSHDPQNQTIYYKWNFAETWKYTSRYRSNLIYVNDSLKPRPDSLAFYRCWISDAPSSILLASTAKLSSDVVLNNPVTKIYYRELFNKLYSRYSILVTESALTRNEYEWYSKLKKNTESLGSIFDAQPSEIMGNIHNVSDSTEPVIGYVGCRSQTSARIFIDRTQLAVKYLSSGYESCSEDSIYGLNKTILDPVFGPHGYDIPIEFISRDGNIVGVTGSDADCADCRKKGGFLARPSFWID